MTQQQAVNSSARRPRSIISTVFRWIPIAILGVTIIACFAAPLIAPYDPKEFSRDLFAGTSWSHLFGTDELGRDLFSRALFSGRLTFLITAGSVAVAMFFGTAWGMAAALGKGLLDEILMRLADTVMAIPQILFALVFVAAFGATPLRLAVIIGILLTPTSARLIRSTVLVELQDDYTAAARAYGAPWHQLLLREVLPNIRGAFVVMAAINGANSILLEASLTFVGLGLQPPDTTWGSLVDKGYQKLYQSTPGVLIPALLVFFSIWMLNLVADQFTAADKSRNAA